MPVAKHRDPEPTSPAPRNREVTRILRVSQCIGYVDDSPTQGGPAERQSRGRPHRKALLHQLERLWREAVEGERVKQLAVEASGDAMVRAAQPNGAPDDGIEHRLEICWRAADDPKDFARRCLLVERRGQFSVARLQFLEQPHVLDGDYRLVGEGLEQRNLLVGEGVHFGPADYDHADRYSFAQKRRRQHGAKATTNPWKLRLQPRRDVIDMDRPAFDNG